MVACLKSSLRSVREGYPWYNSVHKTCVSLVTSVETLLLAHTICLGVKAVP